MEIERKFLVDTLPFQLEGLPFKCIEQGYISAKPTIRIRKMNEDFYLTMKSKGLLQREEYEMAITKQEYEHLLKKVESHMIIKKRYYTPLKDDLVAELDIFEGTYDGLIMVEVEFESLDKAGNFTPPSWFDKEVTEDKDYANVVMAYKNRK